MTKRNGEEIYGTYSMGSGAILNDPNKIFAQIDDVEVIADYKKSISTDLEKAALSPQLLKKFRVMDVGTGRQAIAFLELGARKVSHYDFSPENVAKMQDYIKRKKWGKRLTSERVNLVQFTPPKECFDLVFLHGIVQHFSNVGIGLANCLQAVKLGGYVSLYFYRSGTFLNFVIDLLRNFIKEESDARDYFVNSILLYGEGVLPNAFASYMMDGLFYPHINLYTSRSYIDFLTQLGFEITSSSKLDPLGREVDHTYAHPSVVLTLKKVTRRAPTAKALGILAPSKAVDQLNRKIYNPLNDRTILKTLDSYELLKKEAKKRMIPESVRMAIAFKIYRFLHLLDHNLYRPIQPNEGKDRHLLLLNILDESRRLIIENY